MNPQLKSLLVGILTTMLGGVIGWLITKGIITKDQAPQVTELLISLVLSGGAALVVWLKSLDHKPAAVVLEAKAIPGVSIKVDTTPTSPAPQPVIDLANDKDVTKVNPA